MADQVTFLISRASRSDKSDQHDPASICNTKVLDLAHEWLISNLIDSKASLSQRHIQDKEQSIHARMLSVGKCMCFCSIKYIVVIMLFYC